MSNVHLGGNTKLVLVPVGSRAYAQINGFLYLRKTRHIILYVCARRTYAQRKSKTYLERIWFRRSSSFHFHNIIWYAVSVFL